MVWFGLASQSTFAKKSKLELQRLELQRLGLQRLGLQTASCVTVKKKKSQMHRISAQLTFSAFPQYRVKTQGVMPPTLLLGFLTPVKAFMIIPYRYQKASLPDTITHYFLFPGDSTLLKLTTKFNYLSTLVSVLILKKMLRFPLLNGRLATSLSNTVFITLIYVSFLSSLLEILLLRC